MGVDKECWRCGALCVLEQEIPIGEPKRIVECNVCDERPISKRDSPFIRVCPRAHQSSRVGGFWDKLMAFLGGKG